MDEREYGPQFPDARQPKSLMSRNGSYLSFTVFIPTNVRRILQYREPSSFNHQWIKFLTSWHLENDSSVHVINEKHRNPENILWPEKACNRLKAIFWGLLQ